MSSLTKRLSVRLAAEGGDQVRREFRQLGDSGERTMRRIAASTAPATAALRDLDVAGRAVNGVLRQGAALLAGYVSVHGAIAAIGTTVRAGLELQGLETAFKAIAGDAEGAARELRFVNDEADRLGLSLTTTARSFASLAASAKGTALEGQAARDIFSAVAEASTVLQLSADQTAGALTAISQIISKGKVQTEELRGQLGERIPGAFQVAARAMGMTTAELSKQLELGNIYAEDFLPRFAAELRRTYGRALPEAVNNSRAEFNRFQNEVFRLQAAIAQSGFLAGLTDAVRDFTDALSDPAARQAAQELGRILGDVVRAGADALLFLAQNADLAVTALGGLLVARTVGSAMQGLTAAMAGNAGAAVGLRMMASVSVTAAARMAAAGAAAQTLAAGLRLVRTAIGFVGGPAGVAVLAGVALWELADSEDAAARAARQHAEELAQVKRAAQEATPAIDDMSEASREAARLQWSIKLREAKENIEAITQDLKTGAIGDFWDQFSRFGSALSRELREVRVQFQTGAIGVDEYREAITRLGNKYPEFADNAQEVIEKTYALAAAQLALKNATEGLAALDNTLPIPERKPPTPPSAPTETEDPDEIAKKHARAVEEIKRARREMMDPLQADIERAIEWRDEVLDGLDETKEGYAEFRAQVDEIFNHMLAEARRRDLERSKEWSAGVKRALDDYQESVNDLGKVTETAISGSLDRAEDAVVRFVQAGKVQIADLVNFILEQLIRLHVQQTILGPLANVFSSFDWGSIFRGGTPAPNPAASSPTVSPQAVGVGHTGGIVGVTPLPTRMVDPSVFRGAPRFHNGGVVGDEVPIIAKRGEVVGWPEQMRQAFGTTVQIIDQRGSGSPAPQVQRGRGADGRELIRIVLRDEMTRDLDTGGPVSRRMEQTFGLRRAGQF